MNPDVKKHVRTICSVLRSLYRDALARGDLSAMTRLEEANDMAMRMQNRLKFYALKSKAKENVTLTVDDVGEMFWLAKSEYRAKERRMVRKKARVK